MRNSMPTVEQLRKPRPPYVTHEIREDSASVRLVIRGYGPNFEDGIEVLAVSPDGKTEVSITATLTRWELQECENALRHSAEESSGDN